jgi:glycosyltransferase involved in cell wall biosynthesis
VKVLLVADAAACGALDGPGPWLDELTRHLARRGHRVHALVRGAVESEPSPRPFRAEGPGLALVSAAEADAALQRALGTVPDVVHLAAPAGWSEASAAALARAPVLLDLWDFAAVCPESTLLQRPASAACPVAWPAPACRHCTRREREDAMSAVHRVVAAATRLAARSAWARDRLSRSLGRTVERLACGVDTLRFRPQPAAPGDPAVAALAIAPAVARVLFAGAPTEARGGARVLDLLVALHARHPGVELVVAGRDAANPNAAAALGIEAGEMGLGAQLKLLPDTSPDDLPALIAACDLAVSPGLAPDPHGLALVQAMACARPVVAHAGGAAMELIRHGSDGLLVPAAEVAGFAGAVAGLLGDPARLSRLGEQARLTAMERHDLEPALFALEETYERLRRLRHGSDVERRDAA